MQHRHSSLRIIDNLAEITSYQDRHMLEKSLMKTLNDMFLSKSLRLFRVRKHEQSHEIILLAYCINDVIVSSDDHSSINSDASVLIKLIKSSIERQEIQQQRDADGSFHIVYPAFDSHGDIFAVLLHQCDVLPPSNDQLLVHGLIKVYSNYLALIDKTQRDKLTGLYNRETLDQQITKVLAKTEVGMRDVAAETNDVRRRPAAKKWLGVIDIDKFKFINDNYGHLYGDEVIILVAQLMSNGAVRDDDLVFRYGGEEFVVLLKAANEADAFFAFDRLRKTIAEHAFPQLDKVTISVGFVEVSAQTSPSEVIGQADNALYYAKQNGRNQVHNYHQLVSEGKIADLDSLNANSSIEIF